MNPRDLTFWVFLATVAGTAGLLLSAWFFKKKWFHPIVAFGVMLGMIYTSVFLLLGQPRPVIDAPFWSFDLTPEVNVVGGMIDGDVAYLLILSEGHRIPKLLTFDDKEVVQQLKQAMSEHKGQTGQDWGFNMKIPGMQDNDSSIDNRKWDFFDVPPPRIIPPKPYDQRGQPRSPQDTPNFRNHQGKEFAI